MIPRVKKRDGTIATFNQHKITRAIEKVFKELKKSKKPAKTLTKTIIQELEKNYKHITPSAENIQDTVESILIKKGYEKAAKAYILYRQKRSGLTDTKDELNLSINAIKVLQARYLKRDNKGNIIETPSQMFRRVAKAVAAPEKKHSKQTEDLFYNAMSSLEFLPNSPTLMNAGTRNQMLSACFVLPIEDSLKGIFTTLTHTALIEQAGGGVGFSFSRLRPKGDIVGSTKGVSSGPISFMRIYDTATDVIKQGSRRRGAMMGILNIGHPDIIDFITAKSKKNILQNFNVSVAVTDSFMKKVESNKDYGLINPRTKKRAARLNARDIFNLITAMAWESGDPGLVFIDEINRKHPLKAMGKIESTNPCGESPLFPYESCNLGSINLSKIVRNGKINWKKLRSLVHMGVHFLDNVIEANKFPLTQTRLITKANRKIGLGVMGFAELLIKLKIPYGSKKALQTAERIMGMIKREAIRKSAELGRKRGSFPNFRKSELKKKYRAMRNATVLSIAPTGTISIIAGTSSGIEPLFAISFVREVLGGARLLEVNQEFERIAKEKRFYSKDLMMEIARKGSIKDIEKIPEPVRKIFPAALDIPPEYHVRMLAAFQKHVDNAVSKTVNVPSSATIEDVKKVYLLAHKLKCKGITIYRYGSKKGQVLHIGGVFRPEEKHVIAHSEYSGGCPTKECSF
ncbi:MAG: adenosylcobalamin-dependent ribonucleoside-diphosphate reductase [Candidatus Woesearchaeota archaeon]